MKNRIISISFVVVLALSVGLISCGGEEAPEITEYNLAVSSTEGGSVTIPGEGIFTYDEGEIVSLVAEVEEGYRFVSWTGDVAEIADVEDDTTTITMTDDYSITAEFAVKQYDLTVRSTDGGSVATPGEVTYTYDEGAVVDLVAQPDEGYQFVKWTGSTGAIADVYAVETTITINRDCYITANFAVAICDWYDLDAIRDNLDGNYILMNDLDSTTAGYQELASQTANGGKGWEPIGYGGWSDGPHVTDAFKGVFDGQGYEIGGLFVNRPDEDYVALFGCIDAEGILENVQVLGIAITGDSFVGGLVGTNCGTVNNTYSSGSVTGQWSVGGLVGQNEGTLSNSYSVGSVAGDSCVGGLLGRNWATVSNSYFNYDEVLINGHSIITIGALYGKDFQQWLANDKFLDVNERLAQENGCYVIDDVSSFKKLLAFGQDSSLKFRLTSDLDLVHEAGFYIPYLAGEFDGNGHKIANLRFDFGFIAHVGLFGCLAPDGEVNRLGVENANTAGSGFVGSLVGLNLGSIGNSYASGRVSGNYEVGGLVGLIAGDGNVNNSCFVTGSVTGYNEVGGLVGAKWSMPSVSNSYYNYDEVLVNRQKIITMGALFDEDFDQWLSNSKLLDVNERLSQEDGFYLIKNVNDLTQLLIFGQDASLRFKLIDDLDLDNAPGFYIPYLAGKFDGNGHRIVNLKFGSNSIAQVGLFGYLSSSGEVSHVSVDNVSITGGRCVGGLVGLNDGTVTNSRTNGSITGSWYVGGVVGHARWGSSVSRVYSTGSVTGDWGVGGLVGSTDHGSVSRSYFSGMAMASRDVGGVVGLNWIGGMVNRCYSTGKVIGSSAVGGLVGRNEQGTVNNSFWDIQTSGLTTSDWGTGKTTAEMQDIITFSAAGWNIIAVADSSARNSSYIWNIVDGQTYPFLSWQL